MFNGQWAEGVLNQFDPDIMLPSQVDNSRQLTPAQKLYEEILTDAFRVLQASYRPAYNFVSKKGSRPGPRTKGHALKYRREVWLWAMGKGDPTVSFIDTCHNLDLDPAWVKKLMIKATRGWKKTQGQYPKLTPMRSKPVKSDQNLRPKLNRGKRAVIAALG